MAGGCEATAAAQHGDARANAMELQARSATDCIALLALKTREP